MVDSLVKASQTSSAVYGSIKEIVSVDGQYHHHHPSPQRQVAVNGFAKNVTDNSYNNNYDNTCNHGDNGSNNNNNNNNNNNETATFIRLVQRNRPFRLYMLSYVITHTGEWLTYIASITIIESLLGSANATSRTAIGVLVVVRLIPVVLWMSISGMLADSRDRRQSMICLDLVGAIVVLFFIVAFECKSIVGIYLATFIQQSVAALYEPCRSSIIPLLVPQEDYQKKATTLAGLAWSLMAAVGSSLGGIAVASLGVRSCFILDSFTYLTSAYFMWLVGGTWNVANTSAEAEITSLQSAWSQMVSMTVDGANYLRGSFFGALVLIKASGALVYGASDVLNVSFSEQIHDAHSSERLGILFAVVGIGCLIGPLIADRMTNMGNPSSLQLACVVAMAIEVLGVFGMAVFRPFWCIGLVTGIRSAGSSVLWIDSSLLLQKFCVPEMLGRVLAVDYSLAMLSEAMAALLCGVLQDRVHLSPKDASLVFACIGSVLVIGWTCYHCCGHGAKRHQEYRQLEEEEDDEESTLEHEPPLTPTSSSRTGNNPCVRLLP